MPQGYGRYALTAYPEAKSSSRGPASGRLRAPAPRSRTHTDAAGNGGLRVRWPFESRLFPDNQHRLAALRHGKRRLGGNRDLRQRGISRHLLVHGRRKHAEPGSGAKRRQRLSAQGECSKKGIRAGRYVAVFGAALHAGADHADGANGGVQPAPFAGPATMPVLLLSLDRMETNALVMTQELIANMLGVRREGVTEAAGHLQEAGLIKYSRGRITVLNRSGLEARTCECYAVVKKEFDRLLPYRSGMPK